MCLTLLAIAGRRSRCLAFTRVARRETKAAGTQGIDSSEIIHTVHSRPAPVIPATAGLATTLYAEPGRVDQSATRPLSAHTGHSVRLE